MAVGFAAVVRFVGSLAGFLLAGATGGVLLALIGGPSLGFLGALIGLVIAFPVVRYVLMLISPLRPILRLLYPYEGWTGDEEGDLPPL